MEAAAWVCLLSPLAGAVLITLAGTRISRRTAAYLSTLSVTVAFVGAAVAFFGLLDRSTDDRSVGSEAWTWLAAGDFRVPLDILIDPLSVMMMLIVSGVGALIVAYSIGYMDGEDEERRYFAYMALFVFSMLMLVQSGNLLLLLVGWGLVGLSSYLLIGFHHERPSAVAAAKKAFIMNAIGDATMALAFFLLIQKTGSLTYESAFSWAGGTNGGWAVNLIALGLLGGAVAKSAQLPLQTWLPDAMEGPTPVSALIHAATMVTAGVYLLVRTAPIFEAAPKVQDLAAGLGAATLLLAGLIALVQTDIKRVIAYSTMSQIGYMVMGVSAGAYVAGLFHLMTHAFFKALLFMAAGSVIAAMAGEQNLDRMGGFRKAMPFTFGCMVVGGLALSGFPPFSGFFSKDEIIALEFAHKDWHIVLGVLGYIGSFLTAIYTFRMIFRAFYGDPCPEAQELEHGHLYHAEHPTNPMTGEIEDTDVGFPSPEHHIAEWELPMKIAMAGLALLAIVGGFLGIPDVSDALHKFLEPTFADSTEYARLEPSAALSWIGLASAAVRRVQTGYLRYYAALVLMGITGLGAYFLISA